MNPADYIALAREAGISPQWIFVGAVVTAVALGGVTLWLKRRVSADELVSQNTAMITADGATFRQELMQMVRQQDEKIAELQTKLGECQRSHANCEGEVRVLRGTVAALDAEVSRLRVQIDRYTREA